MLFFSVGHVFCLICFHRRNHLTATSRRVKFTSEKKKTKRNFLSSGVNFSISELSAMIAGAHDGENFIVKEYSEPDAEGIFKEFLK